MATIGKTTKGGTDTADFKNNYKVASKFTAPGSGDITDINAYVWQQDEVDGHLYLSVYSDNAGSPNALLDYVQIVFTKSLETWFSGAIDVPIVNGTPYWLAIQNDADYSFHYWTDAVGTSLTQNTNDDTPPPDALFGAGAAGNKEISIYCNYTPSVGGAARVASRRLLVGVGLAAKTPQFKPKSLRLPKLLPRVM